MSVLSEICKWAGTLPYWEQAALCRILNGSALNDADLDDLLRYMLEDEGLCEKGLRPNICFDSPSAVPSELRTAASLIRISQLKNVNSLVPDQTLTFGPALTLIYGGNGSGKSGYARVLGCAGFTRGDRDVLPDVGQPLKEDAIPSATIEIQHDGSVRKIQYPIGRPCSELSSLYVFDSTSVRVHLTKSSAIGFSPAGLSSLAELAEVTDQIRERLSAIIKARSQPHNFATLFAGESDVTQLISTLGPETDISRLQALAVVTPADMQLVDQLDLKIAQLKSQDIAAKLSDLNKVISDLEGLAQKVHETKEHLGSRIIDDIASAVAALASAEAAAREVSIDKFKGGGFSTTGTEAWVQFIQAANRVAGLERTPAGPYPGPDSLCLLCQQPLSEPARALLHRLWEFLGGDAQGRVRKEEASLTGKRRDIASVELGFFDDQSVARRYVEARGGPIAPKIANWIDQCSARRAVLLKAIDERSMPAALEKPEGDPSEEIQQLVDAAKAEAAVLRERDHSEQIRDLELKLRNLRHRVILNEHISEVQDYVSKRVWADKASRIGGSTHHITTKHNQMFRNLVTDRYISLFQETLSGFGRQVSARLVTSGRKGETLKQISIERHPSVPSEKATPDKVLSEGEKRAVALADFLTEVALDTSCSGIVLDDPVTSLDLEWADQIARMLVGEAGRRQVVVFTHDLPFLYLIKSRAEQTSVKAMTHWIKRGDQDDKPGVKAHDIPHLGLMKIPHPC